MSPPPVAAVRPTRPQDVEGICALCQEVYPGSPPWTERQLVSHLSVFPEGQLVALDTDSGRVVGMAASLVVLWDDYDIDTSWKDMTDAGMFTNHDPGGHTLYGAEVMVDPRCQRQGIGSALYQARRELARRLRVLRIRAGARLRGYHRYSHALDADAYVREVVAGRIKDPTLTFQLRHRFRVLAVVPDYLRHDPESLGYAAVIEWINHDVARRRDYEARPTRFTRKSVRLPDRG